MDNLTKRQPYFQLLPSLFIILMPLWLFSCSSHVARKDGPPNFYVDERRIPNAIPKRERLAKYGNMRSYVVFGRRYHVMTTPKHYDKIGIASWYGTKFNSHRTSSGEPYNMLSMTAAHKTLPLPTYVEVTNLANRRKIIVKVNDRGPFAPNRIIDLSYVAAKKLAMLGHGTAVVRVRAIDPGYLSNQGFFVQTNKATPRTTNHGMWVASKKSLYLQVGAFRDISNAVKMQRQLTALLPAPISVRRPQATSPLYRVQVGPFKDLATVEKVTDKLKRLGIHPNRTNGV